jgi:hypothetical protein
MVKVKHLDLYGDDQSEQWLVPKEDAVVIE